MNQQEYINEDEIDLRELFNTIMKRKKFIFLFTTIVTVGAIVWALTRTPIYEVKSNLQVGFISGKNIADPNTIVKISKIIFHVEDKIKSNKPFVSAVSSISVNKKLKNFIEIKTEAISNDEALKKNKEVVKYIQDKYKPIIDNYISNNQVKIKSIKTQIINLDKLEVVNTKREIEILETQVIPDLDKQIKFYKDVKLKSLESKLKFQEEKLQEYIDIVNKLYKTNKTNSDPASLTISSIQIVNYQNLILNVQNTINDLRVQIQEIKYQTVPDLEISKNNILHDQIRTLKYKLSVELPNKRATLQEKIKQLEYNVSNENLQNSKVIGDYIVNDYPIKPKKKLIVIVAFVTGLILSIFIVFFLEFLANTKEQNEN